MNQGNEMNQALAIQCRDITLRIQNQPILESINLAIPSDRFLSIVGPNGAGKSMLIKIILGLTTPNTGKILVLGQRPQNLIPCDVGYVPQRKAFDSRFPAKTEELVLSGKTHRWPFFINSQQKHDVRDALSRLQSEHLYGKSVHELSGGELQRVFLARAFIEPRKILILDEPAAGIDTFGESDLYKILEDYRDDTKALVILVTHDLEVALHHSSDVLLINKKQIAFGNPPETLSQENIHRAFGHSMHEHHGSHE
ncbi:MAG: ABC transporter ATP-binding protein [Deltaproteobacteria bacterium CG11_big_fil_rev_8_21_14_0_20_45_16]|nr:MAG: ABC transporter ATP-binding protein [Deltaproteobacteria bacterium CG11_big_fil_rev_8_21_14_0_20_45_16]